MFLLINSISLHPLQIHIPNIRVRQLRYATISWRTHSCKHLTLLNGDFTACVNPVSMEANRILCKQGCLRMGYEDQYKQTIRNMTHMGVSCCGVPWITWNKMEYKNVVLKQLESFDVLIVGCHSKQEGCLSQWWTSEEVLCFVFASRIELSHFKECLKRQQFLCTCACGLDLHSGDFLFTVTSADCLSRMPHSWTKWNFHFLVCKWASPSAFLWYLFIWFMWQQRCTLINTSAFTSL